MEKHLTKKYTGNVEKTKGTFPFVSFRYSSRTVSCCNGKTHITAKEARFQDGKFETEEFEGTAEENVYVNLLDAFGKTVNSLMDSFLKSFSLFLPTNPYEKEKNRK